MITSSEKKLLRLEQKSIITQKIAESKNTDYSTSFINKTTALVKTLKEYTDSQLLLAYYPMFDEASCLGIVSEAISSEKIVALPKVTQDDLIFYPCTDVINTRNFMKNSYGILEPIGTHAICFEDLVQKSDTYSILILVPGLAFSRGLCRLGRGKGYYDKFLKKIKMLQKNTRTRITITTIGICFSFQVIDRVPIEEHDIKMDYILTENEIIKKTQ